ncbi:MAG: dynamin family protein [Actinomycetota bacterium]|nr:dynamin family protein [Actinomycetota bacterium]
MSQVGAPPPGRRPVPAHIHRVASLLQAHGRTEASEALIELLNTPGRQKPTVYVAGEAKRGKSCLVNALLSKPDLSPVGVEATTAAPITFFASATPQASVYFFGRPNPETVDVDRARALATINGNPGNEQNVRAVTIGADSPVLAELDLVDTPGVGGLDSGHGALTLQSLSNADALLFVIEGGAQIRSAELQFLRSAAARVDTVVLVLTKTDVYRGWRTIRDDNVAILRDRAPRFASRPIVPVSSVLCLRAIDYPEDAVELREESGVARLEAVLAEQVVSRAAILRRANLIRAGLGSLTALERTLQQRHTALHPGTEGREALEAEHARLRELNRDRAEWPQQLDTEFRKLTLERQEILARRAVELRRQYEERLKKVTRKDHDSLPGELIADLTALGSSVNEMTESRLNALVRSLLDGMDDGSDLDRSIGQLTGQSLREEFESVSFGTHGMSGFEKMSLVNMVSSGRSLGSLLTASGTGLTVGIVAPPIGLAIGFALGGVLAFQAFRSRSRQTFANEFKTWMRDQLAQAQLMINNSFARGSIDLQSQIRARIRGALADREKEINESLAATKVTMAAEAGRRQQTQQTLAQSLQEVLSLKKEGTVLLSRLAGSVAPSPPPGPPVPEEATP